MTSARAAGTGPADEPATSLPAEGRALAVLCGVSGTGAAASVGLHVAELGAFAPLLAFGCLLLTGTVAAACRSPEGARRLGRGRARAAAVGSLPCALAGLWLFASGRAGVPDVLLPDGVGVRGRIVATGTHSAASGGSEVWLTGVMASDSSPLDLHAFPPSPGWIRRDGVLLSHERQPAVLPIDEPGERRLLLRFGCHPWSGIVAVSDAWGTRTRDLYAPGPTSCEVELEARPASAAVLALHAGLGALAVAWPWCIVVAWPALSRRRREQVARGLSLAALAAPLVLLAAATYPGLYTPDSVYQYTQAVAWRFTDWNPPIMAALWGVLIRVTGGPTALYVLHLALLLAGLLLLWTALEEAGCTAGRLLLPLVAAAPPVLCIAGALWKDTGLAFALLCAFGLVAYTAVTARHRTVCIAAASVLGAYAGSVRINSPPAALPLWFLVGQLVLPPTVARRAALLAGWSLACALTVMALNGVLDHAVLDVQRMHHEQQGQYGDLVGIMAFTGRDLLPPEAKGRGYRPEALVDAYRSFDLAARIGPDNMVLHTTDPERLAVLRRTWIDAIRAEPVAYLRHRLHVFLELLGVGRSEASAFHLDLGMVHPDVPPTVRADVRARLFPFSAWAESLYARYLLSPAARVLSLGWLWCLGAAVVPILAGRDRGAPALRRVALAMSVSGALYLLPYAVIASTNAYRFVYWPVVAFASSIALTVATATPGRRLRGHGRVRGASAATSRSTTT